MYSVIRNNNYMETDSLLFDDFHAIDKVEAEAFLNETDKLVSLYKEEKDLGITTTLSDEEYLELITKRQERRIILNDLTI